MYSVVKPHDAKTEKKTEKKRHTNKKMRARWDSNHEEILMALILPVHPLRLLHGYMLDWYVCGDAITARMDYYLG